MTDVLRPPWWRPWRLRRFQARCPHDAYATFWIVWTEHDSHKLWDCQRCGATWCDSVIANADR